MFERIQEVLRHIREAGVAEATGFRVSRHWSKGLNYNLNYSFNYSVELPRP